MARLLSFREITSMGIETAKRFPLAMASSVLATWLAIFSFDTNGTKFKNPLMTAMLGIFVFAAVELATEQNWPFKAKRLVTSITAASALTLFVALSDSMGDTVYSLRCAQYFVAALAGIIVLPFLGRGRQDASWWHTVRVVEGSVVAGFIAAIVFVGAAAAVGLFHFLFDVSINGVVYARIGAVSGLLVGPWLFLRGITAKGVDPSWGEAYPQRLGTITKAVLIPLVTLYLILLYGYIIRIAVAHSWPKGTLGYLIAGITILGLSARAALFPIAESTKGFAAVYFRHFPAVLLPLLLLQMLAIWRRTSEYGWTENRILLMTFALWSLALSLYFAWSKRRDFKVIPVSLLVGATLTSFGPWSPYSLAVRSQISRLEKTLSRNGLLAQENGKITGTSAAVSKEDSATIGDALEFIVSRNKQARLQRWFSVDIKGKSAVELASLIGTPRAVSSSQSRVSVVAENGTNEILTVTGYDYAWPFSLPKLDTLTIPSHREQLTLRIDGDALHVSLGENEKVVVLKSLLDQTNGCRDKQFQTVKLPPEARRFSVEFDRALVAVQFVGMEAVCDTSGMQVISAHGTVLLRYR